MRRDSRGRFNPIKRVYSGAQAIAQAARTEALNRRVQREKAAALEAEDRAIRTEAYRRGVRSGNSSAAFSAGRTAAVRRFGLGPMELEAHARRNGGFANISTQRSMESAKTLIAQVKAVAVGPRTIQLVATRPRAPVSRRAPPQRREPSEFENLIGWAGTG